MRRASGPAVETCQQTKHFNANSDFTRSFRHIHTNGYELRWSCQVWWVCLQISIHSFSNTSSWICGLARVKLALNNNKMKHWLELVLLLQTLNLLKSKLKFGARKYGATAVVGFGWRKKLTPGPSKETAPSVLATAPNTVPAACMVGMCGQSWCTQLAHAVSLFSCSLHVITTNGSLYVWLVDKCVEWYKGWYCITDWYEGQDGGESATWKVGVVIGLIKILIHCLFLIQPYMYTKSNTMLQIAVFGWNTESVISSHQPDLLLNWPSHQPSTTPTFVTTIQTCWSHVWCTGYVYWSHQGKETWTNFLRAFGQVAWPTWSSRVVHWRQITEVYCGAQRSKFTIQYTELVFSNRVLQITVVVMTVLQLEATRILMIACRLRTHQMWV